MRRRFFRTERAVCGMYAHARPARKRRTKQNQHQKDNIIFKRHSSPPPHFLPIIMRKNPVAIPRRLSTRFSRRRPTFSSVFAVRFPAGGLSAVFLSLFHYNAIIESRRLSSEYGILRPDSRTNKTSAPFVSGRPKNSLKRKIPSGNRFQKNDDGDE